MGMDYFLGNNVNKTHKYHIEGKISDGEEHRVSGSFHIKSKTD